MEVGLPGRIGVNAVHNVVRDFKGGIDGVTALLRDGEDPYAKDLMSKEQNALHPLVLVSRVPWGPFFNYVDQILPIIDHLSYPWLTLGKKFLYCYMEKSAYR